VRKRLPNLIDGGGFELLRTGSPGSKLALIIPPAEGYSVPLYGTALDLVRQWLILDPSRWTWTQQQFKVLSRYVFQYNY